MAAKKLQDEVDRTLDQVADGVELFESIYAKMQMSTNQTQKGKLETDLKTQIKMLRRLREPIKLWVANDNIADKSALLDSRRHIETLMEKFKAWEKEMKTKTFSQGLVSALAARSIEAFAPGRSRRTHLRIDTVPNGTQGAAQNFSRVKRNHRHKEKERTPIPAWGPIDGGLGPLTGEVPDETSEDEDGGVTRCICGSIADDDFELHDFMIMCETCRFWQHGECMGYANEGQLGDVDYHCELCRPDLHQRLLDKRKQTSSRQTSNNAQTDEQLYRIIVDRVLRDFPVTSPLLTRGVFPNIDEIAAMMDPKLRGDDAQLAIDWIDKLLDSLRPGTDTHIAVLRKLRRLCRNSSRVPRTCYLNDEIRLERPHPIFQSGFSDVYLGSRGDVRVALKALRTNTSEHEDVQKAFAQEILVWKRLIHPNIVPFLGISSMFPVCLVSLWMPNGSIRSYVENHPTHQRTQWLSDICSGLEHMHMANIVHGDLKGGNILLDQDLRARLTDFGLASLDHHTRTSTTVLSSHGTLRWMPPEMLCASPEDESGPYATPAGDIYSLAMTWWEIFAAKDPFYQFRVPHAAIPHIIQGSRPSRPTTTDPDGFPDSLWSIMESCWRPNPPDRPSVREVATRLML